MNRYLIDTHIFIWWMENSTRLKEKARAIISDSSTVILISIVSLWELAIKEALSKIDFPKDVESAIDRNNFQLLPVDLEHLAAFRALEKHVNHKDPFDRMLVAQAQAEDLTLISADKKIWEYEMKVVRG